MATCGSAAGKPVAAANPLASGGAATGSGRPRSGTRYKRKMPDTQNATTATTMASRSVDNVGAPEAVPGSGNSVTPPMAV